MFEEICIVCGTPLEDARRAYCSEDCESTDCSSPSVSSSSSALSSPAIFGTRPEDIPTPFALGSALRVVCAGRTAPTPGLASNAWAHFTDEEDDCSKMYPQEEELPKSFSSARPRLSYARLPSGTNNRSTVPHLQHRRMSSSSSSTAGRFAHHHQGTPHSAPMSSHAVGDDSSEDDISSVSEFSFHADESTGSAARPAARRPTPAKPPRGSLPSYFSLLQINSPPRKDSILGGSPSSTQRSSPTTPRVASSGQPFHTISSTLSTATAVTAIPSTYVAPEVQMPARGRSTHRSARRASQSPSRERSRSSRAARLRAWAVGASPYPNHPPAAEFELDEADVQEDDELPPPPVFEDEEIDWATAPLRRRGREPVRRVEESAHGSSPIIFMGLDRSRTRSSRRGRSGSREREREGRGRERTRERGRLSGVVDLHAPGFGNGRSGLVNRGYAVQV